MITIQSTEARQNFGKYLTQAAEAPLVVTRPNQEPIVLVRKSDYEFLERLGDKYWYELAMESSKEGYASKEEVDAFLEKMKNDEY